MARKLYGNHIEPACEVCASGRRSADGATVLCERKGVVNPFDSCRRFVYDPLRRIPDRPRASSSHTAEEFEL